MIFAGMHLKPFIMNTLYTNPNTQVHTQSQCMLKISLNKFQPWITKSVLRIGYILIDKVTCHVGWFEG